MSLAPFDTDLLDRLMEEASIDVLLATLEAQCAIRARRTREPSDVAVGNAAKFPSDSSMISGFSADNDATDRLSATAHLIGYSNGVASTIYLRAGVSRIRRRNSVMPSTLSFCSLPSSVAR